MFDEAKLGRKIPVVVISELSDTETTMTSLRAAGINTAEITFRTECAADAISLAARSFPDMHIGAGTVTDAAKCRAALDAGAKFIVSPGLSASVAAICREAGVSYFPGCVTPTEIMAALDIELTVVKFFPADLFGGIAALRAYSSVFPGVRFIPTGGVNAENEAQYLALSNVAAVGGTYLVKDALKAHGGQNV